MKVRDTVPETLKMKRNPFFLRELFFIIFLIVILSSCQKEQIAKDLSPEEVALLVIEYTLTLNQTGLEELLCNKCSVQPFNEIAYEKGRFANALEKNNVNFYDRNAHDFSDIKCNISSRDDTDINLICKGKTVLFRRDRSVEQVSYIVRKETLHLEGDRLTICPPVCIQ
jgi:hypothetical protein